MDDGKPLVDGVPQPEMLHAAMMMDKEANENELKQVIGRDFHSSTSHLDLSRFCHGRLKPPTQRIPQILLTLS